jgi:hypothetical protein
MYESNLPCSVPIHVQNFKLFAPDVRDENTAHGGEQLQTSNFKFQTSNSKLQTPNFKLQTSNSKLQTPNFKLQTPNSKLQTPNSKLPNSKLQTPCVLGKLPATVVADEVARQRNECLYSVLFIETRLGLSRGGSTLARF